MSPMRVLVGVGLMQGRLQQATVMQIHLLMTIAMNTVHVLLEGCGPGTQLHILARKVTADD